MIDEPTVYEMRGAKFLVEQIDACGDNIDKKIRLVAMIMHNINAEIEEHKKLYLYRLKRRSRSRMNKTKPCEGLSPGLTPGGIAML